MNMLSLLATFVHSLVLRSKGDWKAAIGRSDQAKPVTIVTIIMMVTEDQGIETQRPGETKLLKSLRAAVKAIIQI